MFWLSSIELGARNRSLLMKELIPVYSILIAAGPLASAFVNKELIGLKADDGKKAPGRDSLLTCLLCSFAFSLCITGLLIDSMTPNPLPTNAILLLVTLISWFLGCGAFFWSAVDRSKPKE